MGEAGFLKQVQLFTIFRRSHFTFSNSAIFCQITFISKKFQSQTFSITFVLLNTHSKDPKSFKSSKELLPNVYFFSFGMSNSYMKD